MSNFLESVISELKSRIGEIASNYELQFASLKAQANQIISQKDLEIQELKKKIEELEGN